MNDTKSIPAQGGRTSIGEALRCLALAAPDRPAITNHRTTLTRAALEARTNRLARAYAAAGVTEGAFVTIGLADGTEFLQSAIAVWKLGATPQPVSHRLPRQELMSIITLVSPALVVGLDPGRGFAGATVPAGFEPDATLSAEPLPFKIAASWKAPTSGGSTGTPKVIVSTEPASAEQLEPYGRLWRIPRDGVVLAMGPLFYNGQFMTAAAALLSGSHLVIMPRFDARQALSLIEQHQVNWTFAVPTMLGRIAKLPEEIRRATDMSSLQTVVTMSAPCPQWLMEFWLDWIGEHAVIEAYGATEAHAVTMIDGAEWREHRGSVGRPVVGEIAACDSTGRPVPPGEVGELWMRRTPHQAGPYRYIGAEPRRRAGNWESVGDLGWFDDDGYLYLADRSADMIVVGGANVYPAEIEAVLDEHPAVASSCVIGLPDEDYGNIVHAIVQLTRDTSDDELFAHLRERIVPYKLPRTFERTTAQLRDDGGKVRRSQMRAQRTGGRIPRDAVSET